LISVPPKLETGRPSGEYFPLIQPLIANDLNAVTGISFRYQSSIVYYVAMCRSLAQAPRISAYSDLRSLALLFL
jgi:hypothetical protein